MSGETCWQTVSNAVCIGSSGLMRLQALRHGHARRRLPKDEGDRQVASGGEASRML